MRYTGLSGKTYELGSTPFSSGEKVKYMRLLRFQINVQKFTIRDYVPKNWKKS